MDFTFSEKAWTSQDVMNFWQEVYGNLDTTWKEIFLDDPFVKEICLHHPAHIRNAVMRFRKVELALQHILARELQNERISDAQLNDYNPEHARGITNAHLGSRTTDPFDPKIDEYLFKCLNCNLKLSMTLRAAELPLTDICADCAAGNA